MTNTDLIERLQKDAGLPYPPTRLTYALRMAVSGKGDLAYDWEDKPHRLLYDACREAEVLTAALTEANAKLEKAREALHRAKGFIQALAENDPDEPIADNGMTVLDALKDQAPALETYLFATLAELEYGR